MSVVQVVAHAGHEHADIANMTPWWRDQNTLFVGVILGFVLLFAIAFYLQYRKKHTKKEPPANG